MPVEPDEIAEGARLVIGPPSSGGLPDATEGPVNASEIEAFVRSVL